MNVGGGVHNFHPNEKYWGVSDQHRAMLRANKLCSQLPLKYECILRVIEINNLNNLISLILVV